MTRNQSFILSKTFLLNLSQILRGYTPSHIIRTIIINKRQGVHLERINTKIRCYHYQFRSDCRNQFACLYERRANVYQRIPFIRGIIFVTNMPLQILLILLNIKQYQDVNRKVRVMELIQKVLTRLE